MPYSPLTFVRESFCLCGTALADRNRSGICRACQRKPKGLPRDDDYVPSPGGPRLCTLAGRKIRSCRKLAAWGSDHCAPCGAILDRRTSHGLRMGVSTRLA